MAKHSLVIVESPAKAKTIGKYLGKEFEVKACMGHLRDLPKSTLGVDLEHDFEPVYKPIKGKEDIIADLKKSAKSAEMVYLATDPDREGEAISWHLKQLLNLPDEKTRRVTFNEITKNVVQESIVKALAKSDTLRRPEYLKTWFYRILLNESMNHHRRAKRLVPLEDTLLETPVPARDPGERLDLYDAIERLDWKEQTVVRLRFFEDMKLEEIARVTNTNLNTVKSRLYKSLRRLRELTEEEC